ncbi:MAG: hypothetical protein IT428_33560 [Planctomycetaceae bacterium]|nr:hypothetical protein [Planctomycetaceae bacterium]
MKWLPLLVFADLANCADTTLSVPTNAADDGQLSVWWPESLRAHLFLQNLRN